MSALPKLPVSNAPSDYGEAAVAPPALRHAMRPTVLAYHEITSDATDYRYALSSHQLEEHLKLVAGLCNPSNGYQAPLLLSFDDGHISNYTHALPLLEKYSCKAVFFVIAGRVGEHRDFMTWGQLRELIALGHCVEAHSWSHKFLTECSDDELDDELTRSRQTIEDRVGTPVEAISAPHGRWNRRVLSACARAGYRRLYTSNPWFPSRVMEQVRVTGRLMIVQTMDAPGLRSWLTMGRAKAGVHRVRQALKESARSVLGNKLYYQLWTRFSGWHSVNDTYLNGHQ